MIRLDLSRTAEQRGIAAVGLCAEIMEYALGDAPCPWCYAAGLTFHADGCLWPRTVAWAGRVTMSEHIVRDLAGAYTVHDQGALL